MSEVNERFAKAIVDADGAAEPEPQPKESMGELLERAHAVLPALEQELAAGREARDHLAAWAPAINEIRGEQVLDAATEALYEGGDPAELAVEVSQQAPEKLGEFMAAWELDDEESAWAFRDNVARAAAEAQRAAEINALQQAQTQAEISRLETLDALGHVLKKAGREASSVMPLLGEMLRQHPEQTPRSRRDAESLYSVAREGARAQAVSSLKQAILDAPGADVEWVGGSRTHEDGWVAGGLRHRERFEAVEPIRVENANSPSWSEKAAAIKRGILEPEPLAATMDAVHAEGSRLFAEQDALTPYERRWGKQR